MQESLKENKEVYFLGSWKKLVDEKIHGCGGNVDSLEIARNELPGLTPENIKKIKRFQETLAKMDSTRFLKTLEELELLGEFSADISGVAFGNTTASYKEYAEGSRKTIFEYINQTAGSQE